LQNEGGFKFPASQTPWQEIQRTMVDQLADGMVLKPAVKYHRVA
jgi:dihydroxy-acid dehydratase